MWSDIAQHDRADWKANMEASAEAWMDHRLRRDLVTNDGPHPAMIGRGPSFYSRKQAV